MTRESEVPSGRLSSPRGWQLDSSPARVLFVENSVVLRTALKQLFRQEDQVEAFTSAAAIDVSLINLAKAKPGLVVVDADGDWAATSALLQALRHANGQLPLALWTTSAEKQANYRKQRDSLGVRDCWLKADMTPSSRDKLRRSLLQSIRSVLTSPTENPSRTAQAILKEQRKLSPGNTNFHRKKIAVVLGVSTGGPDALCALLPLLPPDLPVPVLIVQHTLASFTTLLVERLQKRTTLPVLEAVDGMLLEGGQIVVAPGNRHLQVASQNGHIIAVLDDGPPENSCRPAVDPLFRSAARVYGAQVLGVVLTGMGQDGLAGSRDLKRAGATVVVQDQASSTVWGMPGQVAQAGLADAVLDLKEVAQEIVRQVGIRSKARVSV